MNTDRFQQVARIFESARSLESKARSAHLEAACAGDPELRAEVERLLAAHDDPDGLRLSSGPGRVRAAPATPDFIGPYRLREPLGEGGMGVVYRAEQTAPVKREVALKLIRPGMASAEGMARFDAERRALALMTHPTIAQVFDAGETPDGRPYFVMEYIDGVPITEYCRRRGLGVEARLELFLEVCAGIQHAHHRGIIHRDLKPSNVLVTESHGRPLPKIIDFGILKAIGPSVSVDGVVTAEGRIIGTPAYMSPEQADGRDTLVDVRTDVYSLGVILYELLTGTPPCEPETLERAGHAEMVRIIVEEEPPRPSTRVGRTTARRHSEARSIDFGAEDLVKRLRGDLDAIVLKALEKHPDRRYDSAQDFALDLTRHRNHEPVRARRQTTAYRFGKFVRKHRLLVTAAALVAMALVAGVVVSLGLYLRTEAARAGEEKARRSAVRDADRADREAAEAKRQSALAAARLEEVLRLSDSKRLADLKRRQATIWPSHPANAAALKQCLDEARALVAALPTHRHSLAALRAEAVLSAKPMPTGGLEDPRRERLAALRRSRDGKFRGLSRMWAATAVRFEPRSAGNPPAYYFRTTFSATGSDARARLELRIQHHDGAVVYLNGEEVCRSGMPAGEVHHRTRALGHSGGVFVIAPVPAGRVRVGSNLLAVRVHLIDPRSSRQIHLAADLRHGRRVLVPLGAVWRFDDRGVGPGPDWLRATFDDRGWSAGPGPLGADPGNNATAGSERSPRSSARSPISRRRWPGARRRTSPTPIGRGSTTPFPIWSVVSRAWPRTTGSDSPSARSKCATLSPHRSGEGASRPTPGPGRRRSRTSPMGTRPRTTAGS